MDEKKKKIMIVLCIAIVLVLLLFLIINPKEEIPKQLEEHKYISQYKNKSVFVNISLFNKELKLATDDNSVEYRHNNDFFRIIPDGLCFSENIRSHYHKCFYLDKQEEYNEKVYPKLFLCITPELDPENDIVEGYIAFKFNELEDKINVTIFLDQEWKDRIKPTNIIWGQNFGNIREFKFHKLSDGIWSDSVELNLGDYLEKKKEGIPRFNLFVGKATRSDIQKVWNENYENLDILGMVFS